MKVSVYFLVPGWSAAPVLADPDSLYRMVVIVCHSSVNLRHSHVRVGFGWDWRLLSGDVSA